MRATRAFWMSGLGAALIHTGPLMAAGDAGRRVIEEVIVTAQKREQGLSEVPASVSVIGGTMTAESALLDAQDIMQYTPNVKVTSSNFAPTVSIRGFGTPPLARNIEPSVGLVINDVYFGRSTFSSDGAFDIERVEVLRGPQGTLFGKNTVSGVINFTTRSTDFEPHGYINGAVADYDEKRLEGGVSFPVVGDVLAGRLSFRSRQRETGIYNTTRGEDNDQQELSGRLKLDWVLNQSSELALDYFQTHTEATGVNIQLQQASARSLRVYREADPQTEDDVYDQRESTNAPTFSERNSRSLALKYTYSWQNMGAVDNLEMALIANVATIETPFLQDTDFSPIDFISLGSVGPDEYRQKSFEIRFTGDSVAPFGWGQGIEFVAGAYAFGSKADVTQISVLQLDQLDEVLEAGTGGVVVESNPTTEALQANALAAALIALDGGTPGAGDTSVVENLVHVESNSVAYFFQASWDLTSALSLTLGLRYGEESKRGRSSSQSDSQAAKTVAGQEDFRFSGKRKEKELSPKLALSWQILDDITLFANVAKGFKSGGFSGPLISPRDLTYEPEEAISMEVGIKSLLFDKSLLLNMAAYQVTYDNLQVHAFNGAQLTTLNAAQATANGVEVDFQWLPSWQAATIAGSFGLSDATYDSYPCAPGIATADPEDNPPGCNSDFPMQDLSGKEIPYGPKVSASFSPSLRIPLSGLGIGILLGVDVLHQGEHFLDIDLDPQSRQQATTKINARLGLKQIDGPWSLVFNAKNLTGEQERIFMMDLPQIAGNYVALALPDKPFYALDLRYSFDE